MQRQDPRITAEYERIAEEFSVPIQVAGLPLGLVQICKNDAESPDAFRRSLIRQMQRTLPAYAPASVRADTTRSPADVFARTEQLVKAAIFEQAHQSPTLRPVVERDRSGREQTSFYGQKRSWMGQYTAPPMLTRSIGGAPVRIPVIL
ncbi:hypothetical protein [Caballeronia sp. KNU42]